ncbi:phage repressor protein [Rhodospirillum rubrum]|uniref:LexA family transcriptional regulator n=2 Tax=Rhodospirillum rubrum TaxID=1085 RepID=UPI0019083FD0|nr:S24 family peptidase [Rhodospirillum rubrum]MBK1678013.1 phage repressor protein [Rhodospirillum rubrum]
MSEKLTGKTPTGEPALAGQGVGEQKGADDRAGRFSERLATALQGRSANWLAGRIGGSASTVRDWLSATSEPGLGKLVATAACLGVPLDWLATGRVAEGATAPPSDLFGERGGGAVTRVPLSVRPAEDETGPRRGVALYDSVAAAARREGGRPGAAGLDLPESYLRDHLRLDPQRAIAVAVHGDSMEPALSDGDLALIDTATRALERDDLYAFLLEGEGYIKRLQKAGAAVIVHSDNPAYSDWTIPREIMASMHLLGRVAGVFHRL